MITHIWMETEVQRVGYLLVGDHDINIMTVNISFCGKQNVTGLSSHFKDEVNSYVI